jgi:hypothetical protein
MLTKLYRKYVPEPIRDKIYMAFLGYFLFFVRNFKESLKCVYIYLFQSILPKTPQNELYAFMGKYGLTPYPYPYWLKYKRLPVDCFWDDQLEMYYVLHLGKRLYYPQNFNNLKNDLFYNYRSLLAEQDVNSPHRYVKDLNRLSGKTLLDIGAAEGILSLEVIETVEHVYLFECEENWIKALNATFAPWKDKITLISKYVSDKNDESNITIDYFLEGKNKNNLFLKMDIEGYEQMALKGASNTLKDVKDLDFSICTYHRKNDTVEIEKIFKTHLFETEFTDGFLYFEKDLRKAIIRRKI